MRETFTRASRSRRVVALMAWAALVAAAVCLFNSRMSDSIRVVSYEPVAFILAAFGAFVGVFAWMLFNPSRQSAAESPSLFLAGAATLFPPAIIAFSLMPPSSPLRAWLTLGIFFLCVIAVLSHVPDEFFGVPRSRKTYFAPMPTFDRMADSVMDPNAAWFSFTDLTQVVSDAERPSLAPKAYLQREEARQTTSATPTLQPLSEVDDILGTDLDIDLFDEIPLDDVSHDEEFYRQTVRNQKASTGQRERSGGTQQRSIAPQAEPQKTRSNTATYSQLQNRRASRRRGAAPALAVTYTDHNSGSQRIEQTREVHRESNATTNDSIRARTRRRMTDSVEVKALQDRQSYRPQLPTSDSATNANFSATAASNVTQAPPPRSPSKPKPRRKTRDFDARQHTESQQDSQSTGNTQKKKSQKRSFLQRDAAIDSDEAAAHQETTFRDRTPTEDSELDNTAESYRRKGKGRRRRTDSPATDSPEPSSKGIASGVAGAVAGTAAYLFGERRSAKHDETDTEQSLSAQSTALAPGKTRDSGQPSEASEFQRTTDAYGAELVEGVMTVKFDKGQKRANIHVPFSPPLAGLPEVECECVGGEDLRLKVPVKQSYGIRIEARRSHADEAMEADVGFAAVHTP